MNLQEARKRIPELDGLSDDAALSVIQQVYYPDIDRSTLASLLGVKVAAPPAPERTWGQAIGDTAVQLAEGVNTTLGAIPSIVAPDGATAEFFRDNADYWRDKQSDVLKKRIAATDQRIQEAGKEGVMSQIGTAASEYWNDPAQAARLVATNLPSMAATLGTGALAGAAAKGVAAARGLDAANKAALAAQYGTRTAMATNAALNAGGARGEAYEDLKRAALAQGMSAEQAEQVALDGSIMPGVVGGVAGAVSGKLGLEKALLGQPGAGTGTALRRAAGAFGAELAGEQIEEVAPKITTNYESGKIDPARGLTDDLGRTMVETAIGAGPGAIVAGGVEGRSTPAQAAADTIRATEKVPESGALTKAVNAGVEAKAQAVEAGALPPALGERLTETDMGAMLGGGGMAGRADPLAGALGMNNDAQAAAITNVANVAERRPPMPASDAARMLDEARTRGLDLAVAEHPAGGFVLVPPNWVTPDMAAQGEARLKETIARMQQADAAPVERAPRTRTDGVGLDLQTDPVQNYLDNLRGVNTPAARAYVRDFDAGRITPADVQQRMQAERGLTPEQRIARAAAEAPAQTDPVADRLRQAVSQRATPAPTDILNPAGEPFKTRMAADRAAKKTPGAVVPVEGGFVVRPQEPVNVQDVPQAPEVSQAAPVVSPPGQATQAVGAQPAGPAAGVPTEGAGAVEAAGVKPAGQRQLSADEQAAQDREEARAKEPSLPPVLSARLQEAHKAHGRDVKRSVVERSIANEKANNTGTPKARRERADRIARLEADLALFDEAAAMPPKEAAGVGGATPSATTIASTMAADGWAGETGSPDDTIWTKQVNGETYTARLIGDSMEVTVPVNGVSTQIGYTTTADPATAAKVASKAVADDAGLETPAVGAPLNVLQNQAAAPVAQAPETTKDVAAPAQETTHNGTRIYPTKVKVGDKVKSMWAVESPDNQRRRAAGERTIGGDSLHDTIEQAKAAAEREAKRDAAQQAAKAEQDAADKARLDAEEARKAANRPKSVVERRKDAVLSKQVRDSETGNVMTRREWVENKVASGLKTSITQEDKIKPMSRMQAFRADNRQQAEHDRKVKEAGKKDVYWLGDFEVTKIEYDYAQELKAQRASAQQAEAAQPATTQQADNDFLPEGWTKSVNGYTKRPVYRMEQGGGQPFAVVTQTEGMTYEVQIRHGDKQLTEGTQRGALSEVLAGAKAELTRMTQADSVTHQDPGEKAEAATPGVVTDSLKKAARNEDTKPSEMRKWLVAEIDKELLQAADRPDYDEAVKRMGEKDAISMFTGNGPLGKNNETGYVTFDVPGDGKYKVRNSVRGLLEFRKNVMASQGFKDSGQKRAKPEQNDGVQGGSGGSMTAIANMIEEGDFEAARDYAEAVGVSLDDVKVPKGERKTEWEMFRKTGFVPRLPDTRPQPAPKTAAQLDEEKRQAAEAEEKRPKDTGWNMAGTGYGGKRYIGRNITLDDGRQVVARVYENAGAYEEAEVKVDGVRKFAVTDRENAQDKADAFIKTLTATSEKITDKLASPDKMTPRQFDDWIRQRATIQTEQFRGDRNHGGGDEGAGYIHLSGKVEPGGTSWAGTARGAKDGRDTRLIFRTDDNKIVWYDDASQQAYEVPKDDARLEITRPEPTPKQARDPQEITVTVDGADYTVTFDEPLATISNQAFQDNLDEYGTPGVAKAEFRKLRAQAQAGGASGSAATGARRDPTKVSMFNPYEDGDIVTIDGQDWTVKQDTPGWYLTNTGNWRGTHQTIRNIKAMADLIREVEQASVAQKAAAPQPEAPQLTQAQRETLDASLLAGAMSVDDYMKATGLTDEDVGTFRPDGLRSKAEQKARAANPYYQLTNKMQDALTDQMKSAMDAASSTPQQRKSKEERIARITRDRSTLDMLTRKWEHPFNHSYVSKLSPILKSRFNKQFEGVKTGEFAKAEFNNASYKAWAELLIEAAGKKAVADGFVEQGAPAPANDRNAFTLQRLNRETGQMEPVTFERGEYVRYTLGGKDQFGDIDGISQARKEFSVDGLWYPFGFAYKAERPAAPKADTVPLSSVIDKVNAKNGQGLTDADRVPEQKPASKTPTVDRHTATMAAVREGKATPEQFQSSFEQVVSNKDAIVAELDTMTKVQLLREGGPLVQMRYANDKKDEVVDAVYRQMVGEYALGESVTYSMGKGAYESAVRKMVEATDADKLANYVAERKAAMEEMQSRRAAKAAALENPQTLADFREVLNAKIREGMTRKEAFLTLTPQQRIQYDTLEAESTREARETRKRAQKTEVRAAGQTTAGEIVATKHTRDGYDLFVVKLADRLSKEDYSTVLASAKKLGGWYSAFRGNGAIPGFQFKDKANAEAFLALAGGDTTAAQEQVARRRDAFEDDRSQTAVERLRAMADKLEEGAAEVEGQQRKTNTERRARFASAAMASAAADKAKAQTMRNIARAIEGGEAKFLDAVRTKSQVDMLTGIVDTAKGAELRAKYPSYADQEKRKGEPPTAETADFADFPSYSAFRSDLATLGRQLLEVDGTKKLGQRLMSVADDVTDAYLEFAKANIQQVSQFGRGDALAEFASKDEAERAIKRSGLTGKAIVLPIKRGQNRVILSPSEAIGRGLWQGDGDKRITLTAEFGAELVEAIGRRGNKQNQLSVPWQFQNAYDRRKALSRIGIETPSEFRAALREFIGLKEQAVANRTRAMELQMVGRKADGLDFFPTSAEVADQMIEAADLSPDMAVLEPSAGMGHLADRIRQAGAEPDVIEISADRRELLEEKGYTTQAVDDFLDLKPREFYTFGDTFRAPDGAEGIMRGANGNRVRLVNQAGDMVGAGYYDRADLTGIAHNGTASGYDRIIMNPPFSNRRDAEHVRHAYSLLKPGGRIVAIMGEGVFFGQDKKAQDFREWLESVGGTSEKLPEGSFMDPSLPVNTSVNARMVVIDKPATEGGNVAMFRTPAMGGLFGRSVPHESVERTVQSILKGIPNAPQIEVHRTPTDAGLSIPGPMPKGGVLPDGRIVVFSDANTGVLDVMRTVFHELFHRGLKSYFTSNADYVKFMLDMAAKWPVLRDGAAQWKKSDDGQEKRAEFTKNGPMTGDRLANYEALAVEESLATLSETLRAGSPLQVRTWTRAIGNMLERIARLFGMDKLGDWIHGLNNSELDDFVNAMIAKSGNAPVLGSSAIIPRYRATGAAKAVGDTLKAITVSNVKERAGFKLTDYLGIGLQALGRRQIVDIYGDLLPLAEYNRLVQQMEADKNEGSAEADQLVTRWAELPDEGKLADLMHDATLAQIDPAEDFVEGDDKGKYLELQRKYNLLSDGAKKVYADTRDAYKAHHAKVRSAIKERIERSEIKGERKAALLKQMDDEFFKAIKGVYFPLARFGQYAVTVKGPDGKVESVSRAETKAEAEALRNNLLSAFPRDKGFTVGRVMLSKDFIADRDAVGRGFMTELYQVLDKQDMDAAQRAELEDTLGQLYLSSLPDLSWAKHGIHRKGTPGFSQDARRAFAQNMFHGARYLAKLRYSDLMQDELAAMQKHVDDWREVEDFDQNSAQRVVDEMNKRHESLMNPKSNPLSTALTSLGFVFHLGLSPASAMVNLSQTALVAYPIMGAKWGFGKASAALLKASAEAAKGKNDITASLNEDERAAYDKAVRAGTIDVTMAHDLAGIAQGEDAGVMWKIRPVMRWASFLFHHAERFNRQVTFVAAYRLAREAGADHKEAFEQATKATYDGHFDYGAANRPRIMQGNVAKVLLLFKQYGQNMVYTLARNAQQAIKGESPEVRSQARKALGGLLATHAAAAGVLGLPMVTTLLAAASMIGSDDDEPWDAKVALQNMLADAWGQKPAEVLAHGLSRLTPWDISGRVGLDRLIFPDVQEGLEGQRLGEAAMAAALGPVAGIGINVLKGLQDMSQGQYARGLESMLPAALRGPVKAIRYESEGVQDKTGVVIKDEVSLAGVAGQFLGFSPSEVRNATEGKSAIYQQDRALGERRQELLTKAARATMAKDAEARAEAMKEIERFNQKNPTRRITPLNVLQSVRNRQKRIDQAEGGVYLPKNRRDAVEAGRFAVTE